MARESLPRAKAGGLPSTSSMVHIRCPTFIMNIFLDICCLYVHDLCMTTEPTSSGQTTDPDRPAPTPADATTRTGRLLGVLRALILHGKQLAATLQQLAAATNLAGVICSFRTTDIARILASITRGLHLATALEAKVASRPVRQPAAPADAESTPSRRQPRPITHADQTAP